MRTAIALFSGGLDSALAAAVVRDQGVQIIAFHCVSLFGSIAPDGAPAPAIVALAAELGIPLHAHNFTPRQLELVQQPRFGFGKHLNPCIDCHLHMLIAAEEYRREIGADFLVSGEVVGQRPMSQTQNAIARINKASGFEDLILRPLSAFLLSPTLPEREGWVNRALFPKIQGRERHIQLEMAKQYGLVNVGTPAGGCLLTVEHFAMKLRDAVNRNAISENDLWLLREGRHFRLDAMTRAVASRNEEGNARLLALAQPTDALYQTIETPGAIVLARPLPSPNVAAVAAGLAVHYSRQRTAGPTAVRTWRGGSAPESGEVLPDVFAESPEPWLLQ